VARNHRARKRVRPDPLRAERRRHPLLDQSLIGKAHWRTTSTQRRPGAVKNDASTRSRPALETRWTTRSQAPAPDTDHQLGREVRLVGSAGLPIGTTDFVRSDRLLGPRLCWSSCLNGGRLETVARRVDRWRSRGVPAQLGHGDHRTRDAAAEVAPWTCVQCRGTGARVATPATDRSKRLNRSWRRWWAWTVAVFVILGVSTIGLVFLVRHEGWLSFR
jgi:hypothetical protein